MRVLLLLSLFSGLLIGAGCPPKVGEGEESCMHCHRGIEQAHPPIAEGQCTTCHGGDGEVFEKENAHVAIPQNYAQVRGEGLPPAPPGFIKDFAPDQLDAIDPDYVRFINPGDLRVLDQTCGQCHQEQSRTLKNSIMATNAGHYFPTLVLANLQENSDALFGARPIVDDECDPQTVGTVCELDVIRPPLADVIEEAIANDDTDELEKIAYDHYLAKNCNTCHQSGYPRNNSPGLYRSTGCTACHMVYSDQGVYEGNDPTIPKGTPTHAAKHEITKNIPSEQCGHCHFQGGRIGLNYRGIREGGFNEANTPENAVPINETLYGHSPGYYFTDEDSTNSVDETPADVHYQAGMECGDCHVGSDVHGNDNIYSSSKGQVDLRCEDCHGTIRERVTPDAEGIYRTQSGRALPQLFTDADGRVMLKSLKDQNHVVSQPAELMAPGGNASELMHTAMGEDENGFSHTDALTCDSCHNSWNFYCIGCHVSYDLRLDQVDYQTGLSTPGLTRGSRQEYTLDNTLLGTAPDGRIQTVSPSQQVNMTIVGAERYGAVDGELLLGTKINEGQDNERTIGKYRVGPGGANNGFAPFFQHTTSRGSRSCATCHRRDNSEAERLRVRGVYGFGTGEFMLTDEDGSQIDGLRFLDDDGNATTTWVHPNTGPASAEVRERALGVVLDDQ